MPRTPHMEVDQIYKLQIVLPSNDIYYSYRNRYFYTMQSTTCTGTVIKMGRASRFYVIYNFIIFDGKIKEKEDKRQTKKTIKGDANGPVTFCLA